MNRNQRKRLFQILLAFKIARYFGTTIEDIFIYEEGEP